MQKFWTIAAIACRWQEVSASYTLSDLDAIERIEWPADAQPPNTVSVPGFVPNTFPLPDEAGLRHGLACWRFAPAKQIAMWQHSIVRACIRTRLGLMESLASAAVRMAANQPDDLSGRSEWGDGRARVWGGE